MVLSNNQRDLIVELIINYARYLGGIDDDDIEYICSQLRKLAPLSRVS
ncbi:MAG: hypothetical protein RQ842_10375 [Vulcanisaeta sp.]|nr:hypothetical protein [Vulcanisaeta sp.]